MKLNAAYEIVDRRAVDAKLKPLGYLETFPGGIRLIDAALVSVDMLFKNDDQFVQHDDGSFDLRSPAGVPLFSLIPLTRDSLRPLANILTITLPEDTTDIGEAVYGVLAGARE